MTPSNLASLKNSKICSGYLRYAAERAKNPRPLRKANSDACENVEPPQSPLSASADLINENQKQESADTDSYASVDKNMLKKKKKLPRRSTKQDGQDPAGLAKMSKTFTSQKNLNRIETFYYEKNRLKKSNSFGQQQELVENPKSQGNSDDDYDERKLRQSNQSLVFKKRPKQDNSYFLSNTVQIQCDMSCTDLDVDVEEAAADEVDSEEAEEYYYEFNEDYYELKQPPKQPTPKLPTPRPTPKPKKRANVIVITDEDSIVKLIFKKDDSTKKTNMTSYEKQRFILKSLYDMRRARLNNKDVGDIDYLIT